MTAPADGFANWQPIETAPKDGTPFVWMHYITILHMDRPHEYKPYAQVVRRFWQDEEIHGKTGLGFWMGEHWSKSDEELSFGYWMPLPPPPAFTPPGERAESK